MAARMVVVPSATALAKPAELTVATLGDEELHVTVLVRFWVLPSVYVPVAVNCCVVPVAIEGLAGVTAMEAKTGAPTFRVVDPVIAPNAASIVVLPWLAPVARPAAVIPATPVADELQVTDAVRSQVSVALNLPVAVYCWIAPSGIEALAGVTLIDLRPVASPVPERATTAGLPKAP